MDWWIDDSGLICLSYWVRVQTKLTDFIIQEEHSWETADVSLGTPTVRSTYFALFVFGVRERERCCVDQRSLTLFLLTEASWLAPGGIRHFFWITLTTVLFPTIPFHLFDPFHPLPTPLPSPTLFRRWKELRQTSSCSRTKCPSTTLNSPGYLKPLPPASLVPLN